MNHSRTLAILAYHKIGAPSPVGWETWYYVPEQVFLRHLTILHDRGWEVIDADTLLRALDGSEELPRRAALLTFDDGYRSVREVALPWLVRFGFPAVVFVPTGFIGSVNTFDAGLEPEEPICDWDHLHDLERNCVSVQSHGVTHQLFSSLSPVEQANELVESKRRLEDGMRKPVTLFAFPYGDPGADERMVSTRLRSAGYRAACLYDGGLNHGPIRHPYRLARLTMGPDTDLDRRLDTWADSGFRRESGGVSEAVARRSDTPPRQEAKQDGGRTIPAPSPCGPA
jgi:peptidoglycan/xylan/chitin deacetylase (PgdA/CDA1 family)